MRALHFFWIWFVVSCLCAWILSTFTEEKEVQDE